MEKEIITMHVKYSSLEVKELSELLYIINTSINDYYRENGIPNNQLNLYAPTIHTVREGSLIIEILIEKLLSVSTDIIIKCIKKRLAIIREKKLQGKYSKQIFKYENVEKIDVEIENSQIIIINVNM